MIDGKPAQEPIEIVELCRGERGLEPGAGSSGDTRVRASTLFPGLGELAMDAGAQMGGGARGRASLVQAGEGHEAVAIHGDDGRLCAPRQPLDLVGDDEAGEVVGNHDDGALGEPGDEASALSRLHLEEGPVGETESGGCGEVVAHPFEHETVQAGARPGIVEAKALVDHEGFATLLGVTESAVEGVVALQAAIRLHPVQDVVARPTAPASSRVASTDFRVAHDLIVPRATMTEP